MITARLARQFSTAQAAETSLQEEISKLREDEQLHEDTSTVSLSQESHKVPNTALSQGNTLSRDASSAAQTISQPDLLPIETLSLDSFVQSGGSPVQSSSQSQINELSESFSPVAVHSVDRLLPSMATLRIVEPKQQINFLSEMFSRIAESEGLEVPTDFLPLSINAMQQLAHNGRSNMLYGLSKGLGTPREDGSDSVFPSKKVVSGLMEYSINFYNSGSGENVRYIFL